jgi:catechol-2,3-dioxygenase
MPVRLHRIVIDAYDLPTLARFWTEALGWQVLSQHEREIVIGTDDAAPVGICFMPVTDSTTTGFPRASAHGRGPGSSCLRHA